MSGMNGFIIGILAPWPNRSTPSIFVPFLIGNKTRRFFKNEAFYSYLQIPINMGNLGTTKFEFSTENLRHLVLGLLPPIIEQPTSSNMFDEGEWVESRLF
ncbi:hypothetical protein TWF506_006496 [Arthrobotrys conoides]|uniref:Uncharacterized protein n=1 Tax=Arthrobotrys conoides TaxID=74498 RepID=A0AAN8N9F8_9PEZI